MLRNPERVPLPEKVTEPPKLELIKGGVTPNSPEKPSPDRLDINKLEAAIAQDEKVIAHYQQQLELARQTANKSDISKIESRLSRTTTNLRLRREQLGQRP